MTAGVYPVAQPARCGCCDARGAAIRCERCDEPTCQDDLRYAVVDGTPAPYVCVVCVEALTTEGKHVVASRLEVRR